MADFKEGYVTLNYVPTHVMTWGCWIDDPSKSNLKELIIFFPGNPGVGLFYTEFLEQLNKNLGIPVWLVSHAGHEFPTQDRLMPNLEKNKQLFDVKGQLKNKTEFLQRYVPKNCKIHLIGHSVGAYMGLNILKDDEIADRVQTSYLLFPVLENIAQTPNGRFFTKVVVNILWLIYFLAGIFSKLPYFVKVGLITGYLMLFGGGTSPTVKRAVTLLISPKVLRPVFFLAIDEMDQIKSLDSDLISKKKDKIVVYYGSHDRWAPVSHYENLVKAVPGIRAQVCKENLDHAFMLLKPSHVMADVLEKLMSQNRVK